MSKGDIETYHEDGQWKNRAQGNSRASNVHDTKAAAQAAGREMAKDRGVEHVIKKMDGTIGEKNSYGGGTPTRRRADRTEPRVLPVESAGFCIFWLRRTQVQMYRSG